MWYGPQAYRSYVDGKKHTTQFRSAQQEVHTSLDNAYSKRKSLNKNREPEDWGSTTRKEREHAHVGDAKIGNCK